MDRLDEPIIRLKDVSKYYVRGVFRKRAYSIRNVDLEVRQGESVGFIGHNGAGKSSTIRIALGLQSASTGVVELNGLSPKDPDSRRGVSYVPENPLLYDYLTPREVLELSLALQGGRLEPKADDECLKWLARLGIADFAHKRIRTLSKGTVQRVALAHALISRPSLLVLDEPLSGLDPVARKEVVDILLEYRNSGGALLFSSHILADIERLATRFVFIHKGVVRADVGEFDLWRMSAQRYEILGEADRAPSDPIWQSRGSSCWQVEVDETQLGRILVDFQRGGGKIVSIRNCASLESIYMNLIKQFD